jgi:hypothetical protein
MVLSGHDLDDEEDVAANVLLFSALLGKVSGTSIVPLRVKPFTE